MYELIALISVGLGLYSLGRAARGVLAATFYILAAVVFLGGGGLHLYNAQNVGAEMQRSQQRLESLFPGLR